MRPSMTGSHNRVGRSWRTVTQAPGSSPWSGTIKPDIRHAISTGILLASTGGMLYRRLAAPTALALLVSGCFLQHRGPVDPPAQIQVAIASVNLGEDCPPVDLRCAAPETPEADAAGAFAPCDGPCCGSLCQQSYVTLAIAADGDAPAEFRVLGATLLTAAGIEVMSLRTNNPRIWDGSEFSAWDETIATPSESQVLYDLNGVSWTDSIESFRTTYRLRLDVEVDGSARTIMSEETTREAPIVT